MKRRWLMEGALILGLLGGSACLLLSGSGVLSKRVPVGGPTPATAADPAPAQATTPEQQAVVAYLRKYANDPKDLEIVECRGPVPAANGGVLNPTLVCDRAVYAVIRGRNNLGALTVEPCLFFLKGVQVVDTNTRSRGVDPVYFDATVARLYEQAPPRVPDQVELIRRFIP